MRKGADCLSKWVGESERQLRLLFEQVQYHNFNSVWFIIVLVMYVNLFMLLSIKYNIKTTKTVKYEYSIVSTVSYKNCCIF